MADDVAMHGPQIDMYAHVRVELEFFALPSGDTIHLGLSLLDGHARLQSRYDPQPLIVTRGGAQIETKRRPTLDVSRHAGVGRHQDSPG